METWTGKLKVNEKAMCVWVCVEETQTDRQRDREKSTDRQEVTEIVTRRRLHVYGKNYL